MNAEINYRAGSEAAKDAWFAYKKADPYGAVSVSSFVAGYNAAIAAVKAAAEKPSK